MTFLFFYHHDSAHKAGQFLLKQNELYIWKSNKAGIRLSSSKMKWRKAMMKQEEAAGCRLQV